MNRINKRKISEKHQRVPKRSRRGRTTIDRYGDVTRKNYDDCFTANSDIIISTSTLESDTIKKSTYDLNANSTTSDLVQTDNDQMLLEAIAKMSAVITYLSEKLNRLTAELQQIQNTSTLNILNNDVEDEDIQHLRRFESFKLPIEDRNHLENLDGILKEDKSFYLFFVSILFKNDKESTLH